MDEIKKQGDLSPETIEKIKEIALPWKGREDMLIEVIRAVQPFAGNCITEEAASIIADCMDIPRAKIYGVSTFYAFFSQKARGIHIIRMCRSAPCHVKGAKAVITAFEEALGIKVGETTEDGLFTLEYCECLGMCDGSPNIMVDDDVITNVSPNQVPNILAKYRIR